MAFVKLDTGILDSTLWIDRDSREVFITALLMAEPREIVTPLPSLCVRSLDEAGWEVPPGWYGFVPAAGVGIVRRAGLDLEAGLNALERLSSPEAESRSQDFAGRRLVRVDGGYIVLNFMKYRDRDYTAADRAKRYRERQKAKGETDESRRDVTASRRDITQAEAEAEAERESKKPPTGVARGRKRSKPGGLSRFPDDFAVDADLATYATSRLPGVDVPAFLAEFRDWAQAGNREYADWRAAFRTRVNHAMPASGHFAAGQYPKAGAGGLVWE